MTSSATHTPDGFIQSLPAILNRPDIARRSFNVRHLNLASNSLHWREIIRLVSGADAVLYLSNIDCQISRF